MVYMTIPRKGFFEAERSRGKGKVRLLSLSKSGVITQNITKNYSL
jgi:hypothetical protein